MKNRFYKRKKTIILTIIILIIVSIGVLMLIREVNKKKIHDIEHFGEIIINDTLERVNSRSDYYIVKNIVEKYFYSLCNLNKTSKDVLIFEEDEETKNIDKEISKEIENNKNKIYNFFAIDCIEEIGLSTDNLQTKLGNYKDLYVLIKDMYVRDISGNLKVYFVFGNITEKETLKREKFELMVAIDEKNRTFDIYTSDYINKNNIYELSKNEDFAQKNFNITEIENRKYNKYQYQYIDDETYCEDLLKSYTQTIKYNDIEYCYNKLDEKYKEGKFKNQSDYEEYIKENRKEITTALVEYYKKSQYDGYKQYICVDYNGNYYVFTEKSIMNYTLTLDVYTTDILENIEKYENSTTEEKVMLNIQKIVEALNEKDYSYVYSKLADEFKENYFKTYEEFEKYAIDTFDIGNKVQFNNYIENENYCTYKITLTGKNKNITKTIVMKLKEGTDFVISFDVN